jgi:hypothetical protein
MRSMHRPQDAHRGLPLTDPVYAAPEAGILRTHIERTPMSFQAYLDTIKAKTGKTPDDFGALAARKGLLGPDVKAGEVVAWLKDALKRVISDFWEPAAWVRLARKITPAPSAVSTSMSNEQIRRENCGGAVNVSSTCTDDGLPAIVRCSELGGGDRSLLGYRCNRAIRYGQPVRPVAVQDIRVGASRVLVEVVAERGRRGTAGVVSAAVLEVCVTRRMSVRASARIVSRGIVSARFGLVSARVEAPGPVHRADDERAAARRGHEQKRRKNRTAREEHQRRSLRSARESSNGLVLEALARARRAQSGSRSCARPAQPPSAWSGRTRFAATARDLL